MYFFQIFQYNPIIYYLLKLFKFLFKKDIHSDHLNERKKILDDRTKYLKFSTLIENRRFFSFSITAK